MKEAYKHRLIGAGLLAAVAVLFLPSFFKDQQQYAVDTQSRIPAPPTITAIEFSDPEQAEGAEPLPPAPDADTMFVEAAREAVAGAPLASDSLPKVEAYSSVASSLASSSAAPVPEVKLNAQGLPDAWMLQLVSLSSRDGAYRLRDNLLADGHKAFVRSAATAKGEVHRVFVGPYLDKGEASRSKQLLDQRLNSKSLLLPFKP